ncbi:MAG TPA: FliM/FliN family flagellar motor switch protein [Hyphomicrobium sp.]|nr:FliM/FliN family flagellar motor switch protein [Hyphomicrobium sp.]
MAREETVSDFASELSQAAEEALPTLGGGSDAIARRPGSAGIDESQQLNSILKIPVTMKIVVGSVTLPVSELRALRTGDILTLDRKVGDVVDVVVNGQLLARGVLVIADPKTSQLGVQLTELAGAPAMQRTSHAGRS